MVIDFDALTAALFYVAFIPLFVFLKRKRCNPWKISFIGVIYLYLVTVVDKTMFPIFLDEGIKNSLGNNLAEHVNLIPLIGLTSNEVKTSIYNILLFIPLGYLLPFILEKKSAVKILGAGFVLSVSIELLQLAVAVMIGFTFRYIDVNDVIANALGALIGYFLFMAFAKCYNWWHRRCGLSNSGIYGYISGMTKA